MRPTRVKGDSLPHAYTFSRLFYHVIYKFLPPGLLHWAADSELRTRYWLYPKQVQVEVTRSWRVID
jgi:hypothetical protein